MKRNAQPQAETPKRRYTTPKLVVHGNLKAMTHTKAGTSNDGGSKPNTRVAGSGGAG